MSFEATYFADPLYRGPRGMRYQGAILNLGGWEGPRRTNPQAAIQDAIREAARRKVTLANTERLVRLDPEIGILQGGADADQEGIAWVDSKGELFLGVPIPWTQSKGPDDPCTRLRVGATERK